MNIQRPPVPKFSEECPTPKRSYGLIEEIQHQIFKMNLNETVEKRAIQILSQLKIPNTPIHALALIHYTMKDLNMPLIQQESKVEYLSKCLESQHSCLISTLCEKLKMNKKSIVICVTLLQQIQPLVNKLPKQLQNALAVKIASDIIYHKQGGINTKIISMMAKIKDDQLKNCLNRIKPFAYQIISNLFTYFNSHQL